MTARTRVVLVLVAAAALGACGAEEPVVPTAPAASDAGDEPTRAESVPEATLKGGGRRTPKSGGDGQDADADEGAADIAQLTSAAIAVHVDDEGILNRTLLHFGAGVPPRSDEQVRRVGTLLTDMMHNDRAGVRRGALALLARMQPGRLPRDPFLPALRDSDAGVRRQAVIGRTRHGLGDYWHQVAELAGDSDPSVRAEVARALAVVNQPEARSTLARLVDDPDDGVAETAVKAACATAAGEVPPAVVAAARSSRPLVRRAAALAFADVRSPAALRQLASLADDGVSSVRQEAVWGMSGFTGDAADEARDLIESVACDARHRDREARFEALQGLARTESAPNLDKLLAVAEKDPDAILRVMAARTLALRGDARAARPLVALVGAKATSVGDGVAEEEAAFVRRTAETVLCDATGVKPGARSPVEWRETVSEAAARLRKTRSDVPIQRIAQRW